MDTATNDTVNKFPINPMQNKVGAAITTYVFGIVLPVARCSVLAMYIYITFSVEGPSSMLLVMENDGYIVCEARKRVC